MERIIVDLKDIPVISCFSVYTTIRKNQGKRNHTRSSSFSF